MLGFILPLRPQAQSKDWKKDCKLLEATIGSLFNQRSQHYSIFVVYTDLPRLPQEFLNSDKLNLVYFPYPFMQSADIPDANEILYLFSNNELMLERRWDKSRKIFFGCLQAIAAGCKYLMSVDADDLISNKLVGHIEKEAQNLDIPGFYINSGYLYRIGESKMISIPNDMQNYNGSTHILHSKFIKMPDFEKGKWLDFNLFTSHGWIRERLKQESNSTLIPIPFPAIVYVAHEGNISNVGYLKGLDRFKYFLKIVLRGRKLTQKTKKEFNLQ